jgi:16S rRNA processing protein RimM
MTDPVRHLVVGRLRKPHGLKGSVTVFPITNDPDKVFAAGQEVWVKDLAGEFVGEPLVVEWSKPYHREWLLKFTGLDRIEEVERLRGLFLTTHDSRLTTPKDGEVWLHELEGFAVRKPDGTALGLVTAWYETGAGILIEVQGPKREFLLPFKKEFVPEVDRDARRLVVTPPDGLIDE